MTERIRGLLPRSGTGGRSTSISPRAGGASAARSPGGFPIGMRANSDEAIAFDSAARRAHTHIVGSTGTGKSKLIELLIRRDMDDRRIGACLIDPHGSLYDELVRYAAMKGRPELSKRLVLFNPAGTPETVVGFNPMANRGADVDYVVSSLVEACLKAWGQDNTMLTPRISRWLENIFHTIIVNGLTLLECAPLIGLDMKNERERLVAGVENDLVRADWYLYEKSQPREKQQIIEGAANRLRRFLQSEIVRNIIGAHDRGVDFSACMAEGKIVLVNLAGYGRVSRENMKLLGIMIVNEIFRSAMLRDPNDPKLKPFHLYIDEFGQFLTRDIARAIEEVRKYRVFLTLAHQHLAQLKDEDEYLFSSVLTNCRNKFVFGGLSDEDVRVMESEIMPGVYDLKRVKDEIVQTKVRYREERRTVTGVSYGTSFGRSEGGGTGTNESESEGWSEGRSTSTGVSDGTTTGRSRTETTGSTEGWSRGGSATKGVSASTGASETRSESEQHSSSESQSRGTSWSDTEGRSSTRSWSSSRGESDGTRFTFSNHPDSYQYGTGQNTMRSSTSGGTDGRSRSHTQGGVETTGRSETHGHSIGRARSVSRQEGTQESVSTSEQASQSASASESVGTSQSASRSYSRTEGEQRSTQGSRSHGRSTSASWGRTEGTSETHSTSEVPFMAPEEYEETTSRTFWSLDELRYIASAEMKNQRTGQAFAKFGAEPPVRLEVAFVSAAPNDRYTTPRRMAILTRTNAAANPGLYLTADEARRLAAERQTSRFGAPFQFGGKPEPLGTDGVADLPEEGTGMETSDDDPFDL